MEKKSKVDAKVEESHKKHHRKRKRQQYNGIRAQMEFYFGDANLSKDRFLKQLINKDPFVPLDVFLTFNKMKSLVSSVEEIAKSLSNSELLELDELQQKVRRKTPLPTNRNVDEKTLYVESIPPKADHDWVRSVFERFGAVTYVSLPKYAKSRKIKEFGFVEFEQEASVMKAVKAFAEFNGLLQMQTDDGAELKSVKTFVKEHAEAQVEEQKTEDMKNTRKRHMCDEEDDTPKKDEAQKDYEPRVKKVKTKEEETTDNNNTEAEDDDDAAQSATETADGTADEGEHTANEMDDKENKKKRRKKRKKSKKASDNTISLEAAYYELKILPKRDWKRLRNQYLNLQRKEMSKLKNLAWKERQQQQQAKDNAESADATSGVTTKANESKLPKVNMNFYGAGDEEPPVQKPTIKVENKKNPALEREPLYSYAPGLIVEVSFQEPCVNVKEFKVDMRQYATVKYVDIKEGAMQAQLRLETSAAAEDFIRQVSCTEYQCKLLSGEAETEYWNKIKLDREAKLNKRVKVPQKRGREKMKKLVMTHLRFDDDED